VLFVDAIDRVRFDRLILKTARRYDWRVDDYCQMTNHFHLLVVTRSPTIARGMQYLNSRHVESFNRRHSRAGTLVQGRYFARLVGTDVDHLNVRAYIAWNPVDAGLCDDPEEWPWGGFGGGGRIVPAPDSILRRFVVDYGRRRRRLAAWALQDTSRGLTPGRGRNGYVENASPTSPGHVSSGTSERTTCAPASAKRANAASASSV
jgi:REP element-mobilizing transposase RayT